ncbi:MAG: hypothetical protein GY773_08510, partial [Actinomycetia bacterium]|nr:hypothetical protein [Actinomycetes bacterium]
LSLMLLVSAGLLIRSFGDLMTVDRGFETKDRLIVAVDMPQSYETERREEVRDRFLERIGKIPTVHSVSAVSTRPLDTGSTGMGIVAAGQSGDPRADVPWASWRIVTGDYFQTLGTPLLRGRTFDDDDRIGEPWRVIISERLAELLWPGEDPIGRTAILWKGQVDDKAEIVGVVGPMRGRGLEVDPTLAVYLPFQGAGWSSVQFVLHAAGDPVA